MVKFTERDLAIIAGLAGVGDFLTEGRFSAPVARAIKKAIGRFGPPAASATARAIPRLAGTALRGARFVTMRHPYIAAAVVTYEVVKNRQEIADLAREGWEVISEIPEMRQEHIRQFPAQYADVPFIGQVRPLSRFPGRPTGRPKRPSKFNSAIKKGMAALKKSTSYGKKGTISNAKRAFATVTKTVSKLMRGKKVSSKGPTGVVKRSLPGFKTKVQIRKK